jgi:amino acid adenylation domain-containing protein
MTTLLQDYTTRIASREPSKLALVMSAERMTYGELDAESNRLARILAAHGCSPGDRICLFTEKSPSAIVAMHATLKTGAAYVPIDLASPTPRIAKIVDAADPKLILASSAAKRQIDELFADGRRVPTGFMHGAPVHGRGWDAVFEPTDWRALSPEPLDVGVRPDSLAHLLFTSGSTGTPKGVAITHASVVAFLDWAVTYFGFRPSERHSGHPPLHFDLSTFDIYGTLAAGAELHLVPHTLGIDPHRLAAFIRDSELTQWFSVPSVLTYMAKFNAVAENDFPALKRLMWCGETLPTPVLAHWMRRLPNVTFTNLYGPTEATIASSFYMVPRCPADESEPIPIGTPCAGEELLVLDGALKPVPPGETGEIFIGGVGLSPGYWRDKDKTDAAFLPDPRPDHSGGRLYRAGDLGRVRPDGLFQFLGRVDSQVKSRGYRIELGEIEAALHEIPVVRECAVVGVDSGGFEGTAICCAYAPVAGAFVHAAHLRRELAKALPQYMLPSHWKKLDVLPKNMNGKIDRRAVREHFEQAVGTAQVSPRSGTPA